MIGYPSGQDGPILSALVLAKTKFFGVIFYHIVNPLVTKLVRSRWLNIGQVLFLRFYDGDEVEVHKNAKMNEANIQFDRTNLVNKGSVIWQKITPKNLREQKRAIPSGQGIGPSCPLASPAI